MNVISCAIPDLMVLEPRVFGDDRGFFLESFNLRAFQEATCVKVNMVQDNHSKSIRNVLRGLHYQIEHPQGKLVRVIQGAVWDVAVDIRKSSPTFGEHVALELSADNKRQLWIPPGFAHGFLVLSDTAELIYKCDDYWYPEYERCILWNDPALAISWPLHTTPILSGKDERGRLLAEAELYP